MLPEVLEVLIAMLNKDSRGSEQYNSGIRSKKQRSYARAGRLIQHFPTLNWPRSESKTLLSLLSRYLVTIFHLLFRDQPSTSSIHFLEFITPRKSSRWTSVRWCNLFHCTVHAANIQLSLAICSTYLSCIRRIVSLGPWVNLALQKSRLPMSE